MSELYAKLKEFVRSNRNHTLANKQRELAIKKEIMKQKGGVNTAKYTKQAEENKAK